MSLLVRRSQSFDLLRNRIVSSVRRNGVCGSCSSDDILSQTGCIRTFAATSAKQESVSSGRKICNKHILKSPFPEIPADPYPPVPEFILRDWKSDGRLDKDFIIDGSTDESRTFRQVHSDIHSIAASLMHDFGVDETSTVALYAPNRVDYLSVVLGVGMTGAKLTPINPLYTSHELGRILDQSGSSVLICDAANLSIALEAASSRRHEGGLRHVIVIPPAGGGDGAPEGTSWLTDLKSHASPLEGTVASVHEVTSTHTYLLPYSSGTTGLPKGVCLSHANLVANLWQLDASESVRFFPEHTLISPLPLFHIYGIVVSGLYCAWRGQTIITTSGPFNLEQFCSLVEQHRPYRAHLVPPIILGLAKSPVAAKYDLSSIDTIMSAAAPLGGAMEEEVKRKLGCNVKQGWGMSELSPLGTINADVGGKSGSVGTMTASTEGKIVSVKTKESLGPGEHGELLVRGPQVMMGYLDAEEQTAECLDEEGWLRTGDIAFYDEDGYVFITDRLKELIKVRGYQVAPAELEALLLTHDHVQDAAVIPVEDEISGELPRAFVVLKSTGGDGVEPAVTEEDIAAWVKERVAPYKRLGGGVVFVEAIPKSASGKLLRRVLRDQVAEQHKS